MQVAIGRRLALMGAGAALLPGLGEAQTDPRRGGTLVMVGVNTRHVNPAIASGAPTGIPGTQIFASPLRFDDAWNPLPYLAQWWELAADGKSLTLQLVSGAVFHDGTPITSADVAFSIGVIQKNHPFKTMLEPVESVETPDPLTAIIRMSRAHPAILLAMSPALCPILPKHIYGDGSDILTHPANTAPVGSGPFRLVAFKPDEAIILERFDKFFIPGRPYLDRIVMRIVPDVETALLAMERQEMVYAPYISTLRDAERLARQTHLMVTDKGYEGIGALSLLTFNTAKKPLDDKRVRQAIAYLADRARMLKVLTGDKVRQALSPIHPGSTFYTSQVNKFAYDLKKAEALLDDAGFKKGTDGFRFKLTIDFLPLEIASSTGVGEFLKVQFKRGGIDLELRPAPDFPTWAQHVAGLECDLTLDAVFNWGDPVIGVHRTYLSRNIRKGVIWSNTQSYRNSKVDTLLDAAASEVDPAKRKALYKEFQQIVVDDVPILVLHSFPYTHAAHKGLQSLPTGIWGPMSPYDELYWEA